MASSRPHQAAAAKIRSLACCCNKKLRRDGEIGSLGEAALHRPEHGIDARVHEFGPPDVMRFERILRPHPSPGEVLVKVKAAGVGPWDGWIRAGKSALPQPLPLTLGSDLSGEVVAVESGDLRVGDQIYGVTNPQFFGAYAEYALASAAMVSRKPTS
jgi:NADPH:quinone reductase-like Zn-dependent oxidoreductase